jgi:hypothetical protein
MAGPDDLLQGGKDGVPFRRVHLEEPPRHVFVLGRRKTAPISTWGEKRNWSSGVTASI